MANTLRSLKQDDPLVLHDPLFQIRFNIAEANATRIDVDQAHATRMRQAGGNKSFIKQMVLFSRFHM
jgi:hypothetical protein